jgi:hypothetical protein
VATFYGGTQSGRHQQDGSMTALVGFPLATLYPITGISQSKPGVVTLASVTQANSFSVMQGQTVTISGVNGMIQVNNNRYIVANFDPIAQTFELYSLQFFPVDTSGYMPYVSGGEINIISYPPTAGEPPGLMYNNQ